MNSFTSTIVKYKSDIMKPFYKPFVYGLLYINKAIGYNKVVPTSACHDTA